MEKKRIIYHIDVNNAFLSWSAVLLLKNGYRRDIRKIPSIIGGDEEQRRGIVLAKSPIAKKYGIVTAETLYQAKKKCKNLEVFRPDFKCYNEESNKLYNYLCTFTPNIERFSIDECFLDMSGTSFLYKDYIKLAYKIKDEIKKNFGYTVNIGIANNKLCAKMASDFEKPDKVHTLFEEEIKSKMWPLPVGDLFMCGKKTTEELKKLKINTIEELAKADYNMLKRHFKNQAKFLIDSANGIDESKVEYRKAKNESVSVSETLKYDYTDKDKLKDVLFRQTEEVARQLRNKKMYAKTIAITYKNNLFETYSKQKKLDIATNKSSDIYKEIETLFNDSWREDPIRLIGIRLTDFTKNRDMQVSIFNMEEEVFDDDSIQNIMDDINDKFGKTSIYPAGMKLSSREKLNKYKNVKENSDE